MLQNIGLQKRDCIFCCNFLSLTPLAVALTSQIVLIFLITFTLCSTVFLLGIFFQGEGWR